jgi:hypothetical protein
MKNQLHNYQVLPRPVLGANGDLVGNVLSSEDTSDGEMVLVARDERLGGGTIVLSTVQAGEPDTAWRVPYGELSILEAPPYSPNVDMHAYFTYWERLGVDNVNISASAYESAGSRIVDCDVEVPDEGVKEEVIAVLGDTDGVVAPHLIRVSVKNGTVLLEGSQLDSPARLAAAKAAASVPGVKEIVNLLVVRAI